MTYKVQIWVKPKVRRKTNQLYVGTMLFVSISCIKKITIPTYPVNDWLFIMLSLSVSPVSHNEASSHAGWHNFKYTYKNLCHPCQHATSCQMSYLKVSRNKELTGILRGGDRLSENCQECSPATTSCAAQPSSCQTQQQGGAGWAKRWMDGGLMGMTEVEMKEVKVGGYFSKTSIHPWVTRKSWWVSWV